MMVVWENWYNGTNATIEGLSTSSGVFKTWCESSGTTTMNNPWGSWGEVVQVNKPYNETSADRAAKQNEAIRRQAEWEAEEQERRDREQREQLEAIHRAEELLVSSLTPEQRRSWELSKQFPVVGNQTGKTYWITDGRAHNIFELNDKGQQAVEFCVHVVDRVPSADNVLAQKLMLEHAEGELLGMANRRQLVAA